MYLVDITYSIPNLQKSACVVWCASTQYGYVELEVLEDFLETFPRRYQSRRGLSYQKAIADALTRVNGGSEVSTEVSELLAPQCKKLLEKSRRQRRFQQRQAVQGQKGAELIDPAIITSLGSVIFPTVI